MRDISATLEKIRWNLSAKQNEKKSPDNLSCLQFLHLNLGFQIKNAFTRLIPRNLVVLIRNGFFLISFQTYGFMASIDLSSDLVGYRALAHASSLAVKKLHIRNQRLEFGWRRQWGSVDYKTNGNRAGFIILPVDGLQFEQCESGNIVNSRWVRKCAFLLIHFTR